MYASFVCRSTKKWSDGGAVARLSSRLHKIRGALRAQPVEGHAYDSDLALDLGEGEFVSIFTFSDFIRMLLYQHTDVYCIICIVCLQLTHIWEIVSICWPCISTLNQQSELL
jgi:hypothetical protein